MAAALIPLAVSLAPEIVALIPGLVTKIEQAFGHGNGPVKMDTLVQSLATIAAGLAKTGAIPQVPHPDQLAAESQKVVTALKSAGILRGPSTPSIVTGPAVVTPDGQAGQPDPAAIVAGFKAVMLAALR